MRKLLLLAALLVCTSVYVSQGLDPASIQTPARGTWPTFNGDYTGRRYSTLDQINQMNVGLLKQAWTFDAKSVAVKSTPLMVNGVLYFTVPDNVWAVDARTGAEIWHYNRPSKGNHIAHRGVAMYKNWLYFGTPDAHLICLDAATGKKVWETEIADVTFGYYVSMSPLVVKEKLIVGISGDAANVEGFLEALDPLTGKVLWKWSALPKPGEPGSETWSNVEFMAQGGGATWTPGSYDPELNLIYWGTGNPHPVVNGKVREGDNLYTCSIVAINADTGKLVWHIQPSPHDQLDRDATETVVLFDGQFNGKPRKMLAQASRNGFFFVVDRATGESLVTAPFGPQNWSSRIDSRGQPVPDKKKEPSVDGTLVQGSGTNWYSPSFSPETNLFYVNATLGNWTLSYLTFEPEGEQIEDHQGGRASSLGGGQNYLLAIDYQTGLIRWKLGYSQNSGILTTKGGLLFAGNSGQMVALDPGTGSILWHASAGSNISNGPITYELDGRQYVLAAAGRVMSAWALPLP